MNSFPWQVITDHSCLLGECPVWDAARQRFLWIDILAGEIHQYFTTTQVHRIFRTGQVPGAFALCASGNLVAAFQNGFAFVSLEKETIRWLTDPETGKPDNRFNDGKCDPAGRFWAGTMNLSGKKGAGSLYALEADGTVVCKIPEVSVSNGLAWSPDHTRFYFIDTAESAVAAFDYDLPTGRITNRTIVVAFPPQMGKPDGMTIDTEGMLWVALWKGWGVARCNPQTGEILQHIQLPVSQVTSCTFGGKEWRDLYITTAKTGLSPEDIEKQPLAGSVFVIKNTGFKGLPAHLFNDR